MSEEGKIYLRTTPGTQIEFAAKRRKRPCWRCRLRLRRPVHWNCAPLPKLTYLDGKP